MFFQRKRIRKEARALLELLDFAKNEVHPDNFVTSEDLALKLRPKLVSLNQILGLPDGNCYSPVSYEALVHAVSGFENEGLLQQLFEILSAKQEIVCGALISAAKHEYTLRKQGKEDNQLNLGFEIRESAIATLNYLNMGGKRQV